MPSLRARWSAACLAVSVCLLVPAFLIAQSTGGRVLGRISDPTGAVLPEAKVILTNEATGVGASTTSNANGDYVFPQVAVGSYRMEFDLKGFKKNIQRGVNVDLNQVVTVNSVLQIGQTQETVDVTSEAPVVDTTSTQLGAVMDSAQVSGLPLNSRDTYQLLQLQPGVQGVGGSDLFYGSNSAGAVSVNGGRGRSNNFSVNGGDGNDLFVNGPAIQPSPDSISEFRVLSNTFDAEYGRNSGAVINVVTKSGTNQWHGSVYEFFRNKVLDSKGYLDPAIPDNKQNQFGGTFGGAIKKDRTFFFASYEGRRVVQGIVGDPTVVPTAAERGGDFSQSPFGGTLTDVAVAQILQNRPNCLSAITLAGGTVAPGTSWGGPGGVFPNYQIPTSCFDPVANNLLTQYVPLPNAPNSIFQSIPNSQQHANQFTVKVDHHINDRQNLSVYYYFNDSYEADPFTKFQVEFTNLLPGFGDLNKTRSQQWNVSHTWTVSNSVVNEARITYFREGQGTFLSPQNHSLVTNSCNPPVLDSSGNNLCFTGTTDTPTVIIPNPKIGITPGLGALHEGVPDISVAGGFSIGNDFEGELPQIGNTYQFSDNLTKVKGNHTMKFGVDLRNQRFFQTLYFSPQGDFTYSGGGSNDFAAVRNSDGSSNLFPNYLMGLPDTDLMGSTNSEDVRGNAFYLFAQDSWKIKPNLTVNYGLRWEYNQPFYDAGGRYQTFRPGQTSSVYDCSVTPAGNCPVGLVVPGDPGVPKGLTKPYYKSFAPRIGIAWDPQKDGKMTIRGGFGVFYNPIEQLVLEQFQAEPPFGGSTTVTEGFFNTPFVLQSCATPPLSGPCQGTGASGGAGVLPNPFGSILNPPRGTPFDWSIFRPILLFGELQPQLRSQYTEQYNFGIERELFKNTVLSIGYVGSQGHRLLATHDLSPANAQTCLDLQNISNLTGDATLSCGPFFGDSSFSVAANEIPAGVTLHMPYGPQPVVTGPNPNPITLVGLRPYSSPTCDPTTGNNCPADGIPVFSSIFAQDTIANSSYNSLQASLERRLSNGLQFEIAYTYSKSLDDASSFENALKPICNGVLNNFSCNRGYSLFDARQRLVLSYLWELPVPKYSGAKGMVLDGWAVSGITSFQSGFPIRMITIDDQELENDTSGFEAPGRPVENGPVHFVNPRSNSSYYFCPGGAGATGCNISDPELGTLGGPRTICCGPGINNFDMSVQKGLPFTETVHGEFRAEFFNIFNHTQFLNPDGNISDGPDFGRVTHTREPRQIQFAFKLSF
jgi:Carboxypeptidase regulatory-like domain/TonB dependent receptor